MTATLSVAAWKEFSKNVDEPPAADEDVQAWMSTKQRKTTVCNDLD